MSSDGKITIIRGDARALPLPDDSVDLICTSPPYWGLRDYRDGEASLAGQIGAEPTPQEYLEALWECTRDWMRTLKPEGSLWINLGDKYSQRPGQFGPQGETGQRATRTQAATYVDAPARRDLHYGVAPKSLMGLPWRYAIGTIDHLGLILRAEVIWSKANGLPESVVDRVRRSHEQWFHFVKQPQYYSAVDEIREPYSDKTVRTYPTPYAAPGTSRHGRDSKTLRTASNPLGALPGSVWEIASQPLTVPEHLNTDHFAAYPFGLPRRIIRGWSPPGICVECGAGRRPCSVREAVDDRPGRVQGRDCDALLGGHGADGRAGSRRSTLAVISGHACACATPDAPTRAAVVVDPFGGTGTTALVASVLGRHGISVDRSADYCRIAQWRTTDPGERARAMGVPKPPPANPAQERLFSEVSDASQEVV